MSIRRRSRPRSICRISPPAAFKGERPEDHVVLVTVNGKTVSTLRWNGRDEIRREITLPSSALKARANTLALQVPKRRTPWDAKSDAIDVVMFNWIEAKYPLNGDLDAGALPFSLTS